MKEFLLKYSGINLGSLYIVPGLTSLFYSIIIFLGIYMVLTLAIAIAAFQYMPITIASNRVLIIIFVISSVVGYSYFLLNVFIKENPFLQLTIAFFTGLFLATIIATLVLMVIFKDYFNIQDQVLQVYVNNISHGNLPDLVVQRLNTLWYGDEGQPSFLVLVFMFVITTLMLPWVVCVRFARSSDYRAFNDFNKIQHKTI